MKKIIALSLLLSTQAYAYSVAQTIASPILTVGAIVEGTSVSTAASSVSSLDQYKEHSQEILDDILDARVEEEISNENIKAIISGIKKSSAEYAEKSDLEILDLVESLAIKCIDTNKCE